MASMLNTRSKPVPYSDHFAKVVDGKATNQCAYSDLPDNVIAEVFPSVVAKIAKRRELSKEIGELDNEITGTIAPVMAERFQIDTTKGRVIVSFGFGKVSWTAAKGTAQQPSARKADYAATLMAILRGKK